MRYYELSITQPGAGSPQLLLSTKNKDGRNNANALDIFFDMPVAPSDVGIGAQTITIRGLGIDNLTQGKVFVGGTLVLKGGMQKGMPLANPKQAGVLLVGTVWQSFTNWVGTVQELELRVLPVVGTLDAPAALVLNAPEGVELGSAVVKALQNAYPDKVIQNRLKSQYISVRTLYAYYGVLSNFASDVYSISAGISDNNTAIRIAIQKDEFLVYEVAADTSALSAASADRSIVALEISDLVGQPSWIKPGVMQVTCILRADIMIGTQIKMPEVAINAPGFVQTLAPSLPSSLNYTSAFKGNFLVSLIRHIGGYRSLDDKAWVTVIEAVIYGS